MSDDFYFEEEVFPARHASTEQPPLKKGLSKGVKRLLLVVAVFLMAELIWLLVIQPSMPLSKISVSGMRGLSDGEILSYAGIGAQNSWFQIDPVYVAKTLESHWLIEKARVEKHFPDALTIQLEGRKAAGVAFTQIDGLSVPVYFDRKGVIFNIGGSLSGDGYRSVPVITGIISAEPYLGERISAQYLGLLEDIGAIQMNEPVLLDAVSEIRIKEKMYSGFDLVLYPVHNQLRVLMDNHLTGENLRFLILILDVLKRKDPDLDEFDFRAGGIASFMVKEVFSD